MYPGLVNYLKSKRKSRCNGVDERVSIQKYIESEEQIKKLMRKEVERELIADLKEQDHLVNPVGFSFNSSDDIVEHLKGFTKQQILSLIDVVSTAIPPNPHSGRKRKLTPLDVLLILLTYLRHSKTVSVLASDFGVNPSTISLHSLHYPLDFPLLASKYIIQTQRPIPDFSDCIGFIDGTCQERGAPKDKAVYPKYACGHHSTPDLKSVMINDVDGRCMFVAAGFMSELKIFDNHLRQQFLTPPHGLIGDSGYQGLDSYGVVAHFVHKKDHVLNEQEVKENHKVR